MFFSQHLFFEKKTMNKFFLRLVSERAEKKNSTIKINPYNEIIIKKKYPSRLMFNLKIGNIHLLSYLLSLPYIINPFKICKLGNL